MGNIAKSSKKKLVKNSIRDEMIHIINPDLLTNRIIDLRKSRHDPALVISDFKAQEPWLYNSDFQHYRMLQVLKRAASFGESLDQPEEWSLEEKKPVNWKTYI